jgi:hypothetical protein
MLSGKSSPPFWKKQALSNHAGDRLQFGKTPGKLKFSWRTTTSSALARGQPG